MNRAKAMLPAILFMFLGARTIHTSIGIATSLSAKETQTDLPTVLEKSTETSPLKSTFISNLTSKHASSPSDERQTDLPTVLEKSTEKSTEKSPLNSTFISNSISNHSSPPIKHRNDNGTFAVAPQTENLYNESTTCPEAIQLVAGLYQRRSNTTASTMLESTVLMTAVDSSFWELYLNWKRFIERAGLQHVVMALDRTVYERLGPKKSILYDTTKMNSTTDTARPRMGRLQKLCSKLQMKLSLLERCPDLNLVFSDVDVVLLRDPFQHDLGSLIVHQYDYVYSVESSWLPQQRSHACLVNQTFGLQAFTEGNTGLEYFKGNTQWTIKVLRESFKRCMIPANTHHDQAVFWRLMRRRVFNKQRWIHCSVSNYGKAQPRHKANRPSLCCLDPYDYPSGFIMPKRSDDAGVVTLHANAISTGVEGKIEKLKTWVNGWIDE